MNLVTVQFESLNSTEHWCFLSLHFCAGLYHKKHHSSIMRVLVAASAVELGVKRSRNLAPLQARMTQPLD